MIRTRMAPSPTGWLHVGTARTTLFNYLFTRKNNGTFVLRIEDTDHERSRKEFEDDIVEHLTWLGLSWDEGPIIIEHGAHNMEQKYRGTYGPYRQSERLDTYEKALTKLLDEGDAFYCGHTKEELEAKQKEQIAQKEAPRHVCNHREEGRAEGIIRIKNNVAGEIIFTDTIRGEISFEAAHLGDFSLARDISSPLYNFVVVVDDHEMRISHVIRGEDHIPNTPKQILIQEALGFERPQYAHLPLLLGTDRSKLSKRHGAVSVREYRAQGFLPEALVNFLALLGWNPGDNREIFSLAELEQEFSLEKVQKAGAVFNEEKLRWVNREHIRRLPQETLITHIQPFIHTNISEDTMGRIAIVEKERLERLSDIEEHIMFYASAPQYEKELLAWKGTQAPEETQIHLTAVRNILCDIPKSDFSDLEKLSAGPLMTYATEHGKGNVLWPLRAAVSGKKASPGPFEIIYVLGKKETLQRIDHALELLKK